MPLHSSTAVFRQVLLSPGPFFTDRSPRTGVGFGVVARVAVAHILVVFAGLLLVGVRVATLDASVGIGNAVGVVGESIVLGILVFVNWLVVSVVLHVPAEVLHGEGTVGDTLFVVAWSSPVALLLPVATLVALVLAVGDTGSAEAAIRQLDALRGALDGVGALAAFAVLLWQGAIWIAGLKRTHDMPGELAAIAAFVTVCLGLLATLAA